MSGVHVIAEAGNNHNGDLETARRLIDVAKAGGADSVKFQIIYPEGLYLPRLLGNGGYEDNEVFEARKKFILSEDDYRSLAEYCGSKGIGFSASIFDRRGLNLLDSLDPPYFKIASTDLNNIAFVREVAERGRRVVLSTGMATLTEVESTVEALRRTGNDDIVLLHCVSVYPVTLPLMRLRFIDELRQFGYPVGLSDHTQDSLAAVIGVAKGVVALEKHFTLDRSQEGFDHGYAMEPDALERYVQDVRDAEAAIAPTPEKVSEPEQATAERARRSIYAAFDLEEGTELIEEHLLVVRPPGPLSAADFDAVLGRRLKRPLRQFEALTKDDFTS